jgi:hypothetical protein
MLLINKNPELLKLDNQQGKVVLCENGWGFQGVSLAPERLELLPTLSIYPFSQVYQAKPSNGGEYVCPLSVAQNDGCPPVNCTLMQNLQKYFWPHPGNNAVKDKNPTIIYRYLGTMHSTVQLHFETIFQARVNACFAEIKRRELVPPGAVLDYNILSQTSSLRWNSCLNLEDTQEATKNFTTNDVLPWHYDHPTKGFKADSGAYTSKVECEFRTVSKMAGQMAFSARGNGIPRPLRKRRKRSNRNWSGGSTIVFTGAALTQVNPTKGTGICGGAGSLGPDPGSGFGCSTYHTGENYGSATDVDRLVVSIDHSCVINGVPNSEKIRAIRYQEIIKLFSAYLAVGAADVTTHKNMEDLWTTLGHTQTDLVKEEGIEMGEGGMMKSGFDDYPGYEGKDSRPFTTEGWTYDNVELYATATRCRAKKAAYRQKKESDNDTVSEVGQTVLHPDHGQGVVTGFSRGWTNVRFSSGSELSQQSTPCRKKDLSLSLTPPSSSTHPVDDDDDATPSFDIQKVLQRPSIRSVPGSELGCDDTWTCAVDKVQYAYYLQSPSGRRFTSKRKAVEHFEEENSRAPKKARQTTRKAGGDIDSSNVPPIKK